MRTSQTFISTTATFSTMSDPVLPYTAAQNEPLPVHENLQSQDAANSIHLLAEAAERRKEDVEQYPKHRNREYDEVKDEWDASILQNEIEQDGMDAYLSLINFSGMEFHRLGDKISAYVSYHCRTGRGRRTQ